MTEKLLIRMLKLKQTGMFCSIFQLSGVKTYTVALEVRICLYVSTMLAGLTLEHTCNLYVKL